MYYLKTNSSLSLIAKYTHPELQTKHQKHLQIGERLRFFRVSQET
jgi:hypothetical protein